MSTRHLLGGVVVVPEALRAQWVAENLAAEVRFAAAARASGSRRSIPFEHTRETELAPAELVAAACACGPACECSASTQCAAAA
jgi:hypothetical protein